MLGDAISGGVAHILKEEPAQSFSRTGRSSRAAYRPNSPR